MEKDILLPITRRRPLEEEKKSRAISRHDFFGWIERNFSLSFFLHFGTKIDRSRTLDHVVWNIWDKYQKKKKKLIGGIFISWDRYIVLHKQNAIWHKSFWIFPINWNHRNRHFVTRIVGWKREKKKKKSRLDERGNRNTWRAILESWIESDKRRAVGYRDEIT